MFRIVQSFLDRVFFECRAGFIAGTNGFQARQRLEFERVLQCFLELAKFPRICGRAKQPHLEIQDLLLKRDEFQNALPANADHFRQLGIVEGRFLGGGLQFDEAAGSGHHHIHVDLCV
jgi:hypothetical protein